MLKGGHVIKTNSCTLTTDNYTGKASMLILWWVNCWTTKELPILIKSPGYMRERHMD
jgi:hypothetical protein